MSIRRDGFWVNDKHLWGDGYCALHCLRPAELPVVRVIMQYFFELNFALREDDIATTRVIDFDFFMCAVDADVGAGGGVCCN